MDQLIQEANNLIDELNKESTEFKILKAMLNSFKENNSEPFKQTQSIIAKEIITTKDLQALAEEYHEYFLLPMWAKEPVQKSSKSINELQTKVRERFWHLTRDENKCALTGKSDLFNGSISLRRFQISHFIPPCLAANDQTVNIENK